MKKLIYLLLTVSLLLYGCGNEAKKPVSDERQVEKSENSKQDISPEKVEKEILATSGEVKEMPELPEFSYNPIMLEDVMQLLDENGIYYEGYYNTSGERIDITLEDGTELIFFETRNPDMNVIGYELIMKDDEFNSSVFQERYLNAYDVIIYDYFYPDSSERVLEEEELYGMNQTDLSIFRNELFARYGRKFNDPFLNAVFSQKDWYNPIYEGAEFDTRQQEYLTEIEQENLHTIMKVEAEMGYRKTGNVEAKSAKSLLSGSWLDLDGNGVKEQIIYQISDINEGSDWEEIGEITFLINEKQADGTIALKTQLVHEGIWLYANCYVASMDGENYFLLVADNGFSADYQLSFYQYKEGTLDKVGEMYTYPVGLKVYSDRMEAMEESYHLQCQPIKYEYKLENGKFVKQKADYYEYRQNVVTVLRDVPLYSDKNSSEINIILVPGDEVKVVGGDMKEWVLMEKVSTGEEGWLKVIGSECRYPDGSGEESVHLFEGLTFYG